MLRRLVAQGRHVVVALEMFPPSVDPVLERWRLGKLDEAAFVRESGWYEHWGFPWATYRELFLFCRVHEIPMHGVNAEDATRKAVHADKLDELAPALRAELGNLDEPLEPRRQYVLDALRAAGHGAKLGPGDPTFERMYRVQRMWDRLMGGRSARLAEAAGPDAIVVLLIGSGPLAYRLGANLEAARTAFYEGFVAEAIDRFVAEAEGFDVTGAGDTVLAIAALALASGGTLEEAAWLANVRGAGVGGKVGAATRAPAEGGAAGVRGVSGAGQRGAGRVRGGGERA